jgi:hypothetical protein
MATEPLCSVCGELPMTEPITICKTCGNHDRVRSYCRLCHARTDLSLTRARRLYGYTGIRIPHAGIVYIYKYGCPACKGTAIKPQQLILDGIARFASA